MPISSPNISFLHSAIPAVSIADAPISSGGKIRFLHTYIGAALFIYSTSLMALNIPWTSLAFAGGIVLMGLGAFYGRNNEKAPRSVFWVATLMLFVAYYTQGIRMWYFSSIQRPDKAVSIPIFFQLILWGIFCWTGSDKQRFFFLFRCLYWLITGSVICFMLQALFPMFTKASEFFFNENIAGFSSAPHLFGYHLCLALPLYLALWLFDRRNKKWNFLLLLLTLLAGVLLVERSVFLAWGGTVVLLTLCGKFKVKYVMFLIALGVLALNANVLEIQKYMTFKCIS